MPAMMGSTTHNIGTTMLKISDLFRPLSSSTGKTEHIEGPGATESEYVVVEDATVEV